MKNFVNGSVEGAGKGEVVWGFYIGVYGIHTKAMSYFGPWKSLGMGHHIED